ncbi:hypothetical protein DIPPA_07865 [Diplonema papillatum]|nr:hypothetical protein DIPPA_07865 [Diplonema papillatum]
MKHDHEPAKTQFEPEGLEAGDARNDNRQTEQTEDVEGAHLAEGEAAEANDDTPQRNPSTDDHEPAKTQSEPEGLEAGDARNDNRQTEQTEEVEGAHLAKGEAAEANDTPQRNPSTDDHEPAKTQSEPEAGRQAACTTDGDSQSRSARAIQGAWRRHHARADAAGLRTSRDRERRGTLRSEAAVSIQCAHRRRRAAAAAASAASGRSVLRAFARAALCAMSLAPLISAAARRRVGLVQSAARARLARGDVLLRKQLDAVACGDEDSAVLRAFARAALSARSLPPLISAAARRRVDLLQSAARARLARGVVLRKQLDVAARWDEGSAVFRAFARGALCAASLSPRVSACARCRVDLVQSAARARLARGVVLRKQLDVARGGEKSAVFRAFARAALCVASLPPRVSACAHRRACVVQGAGRCRLARRTAAGKRRAALAGAAGLLSAASRGFACRLRVAVLRVAACEAEERRRLAGRVCEERLRICADMAALGGHRLLSSRAAFMAAAALRRLPLDEEAARGHIERSERRIGGVLEVELSCELQGVRAVLSLRNPRHRPPLGDSVKAAREGPVRKQRLDSRFREREAFCTRWAQSSRMQYSQLANSVRVLQGRIRKVKYQLTNVPLDLETRMQASYHTRCLEAGVARHKGIWCMLSIPFIESLNISTICVCGAQIALLLGMLGDMPMLARVNLSDTPALTNDHVVHLCRVLEGKEVKSIAVANNEHLTLPAGKALFRLACTAPTLTHAVVAGTSIPNALKSRICDAVRNNQYQCVPTNWRTHMRVEDVGETAVLS